MMSGRGRIGLTERQVEHCLAIWSWLGGDEICALDVSRAQRHESHTVFSEDRNVVFLGADVVPGMGLDARSRLSELACLAHEMSHADRFRRNYQRPLDGPGLLLDEAEASLNASFFAGINAKDREDLVEDARDRTIEWLAQARSQEAENEG